MIIISDFILHQTSFIVVYAHTCLPLSLMPHPLHTARDRGLTILPVPIAKINVNFVYMYVSASS